MGSHQSVVAGPTNDHKKEDTFLAKLKSLNGNSAVIYPWPGEPLFERLPAELIARILHNLDTRTLLHSCALTCRSWNTLLDTPDFWRSACASANQRLPSEAFSRLDVKSLARLAHFKPLNRNLIQNPSGELEFKHWTIKNNGHSANGFKIERPPVYSSTTNTPVCFATTYVWCDKEQIIDLHAIGLTPDLIALQPTIIASESHAARQDCASTYRLNVKLCDGYVEHRNTPQHRNGRSRIFDPGYRDFDREDVSRHFNECASKSSETVIEQWSDGKWRETRLVFPAVPENTVYVAFTSQGKDNQFWAGHYGAKMAFASVVVSFDYDEESMPTDLQGEVKVV